MVIVDSSVWVRAFRPGDSLEREKVDSLVAHGEAGMVGPVQAEVLQGARSQAHFVELQTRLAALPYLAETRETWIQVANLSWRLRQHGVTVGLIDLLIAALALEHDCELYTLDEHFQRIPGVKLYEAGRSREA